MMRRPIWLILVLLVASLACYSDSPLWFNELTPSPPTITPLPTPLAQQSRFQVHDLAWVPASVTEAAFRLDLTTDPTPLKPDLSNKSPQSCSQNTMVQILYSGIDPFGTLYQLVDCNGVVGWTPEDRLLGPIDLVMNDRALTTEAGLDEAGQYKIEVSDPPYRQDDPFRQKLDCRLNETVDVIGLSGFSTGELYYKIRCQSPLNPVQRNVGWVLPQALFGPVRFRNGEAGIVGQEFEAVRLTSEPNGGDILGSCEPNEVAEITATPVQRLGEQLFYEFECLSGTGWASQDFFVGPIIYPVGASVLVTAPNVVNSAEARTPPPTPATEAENPPPAFEPPHVILTTKPEPLLLENAAESCPDAAIVTIQAISAKDDQLYAEVDCLGNVGWLDTDFLYGTVNYALGEKVQLGEKALLGFGERGIYLSINVFNIEGPSGGSRVIAGACAFDFESLEPIEATLLDVGYYRTSTGQIAGILYFVECLGNTGEMIRGWLNQDRITP